MRLPSVALLIALVVPLSATAQPTKQVEVTNFPDPQTVTGTVEVTNDATNPVVVVGEVEVTNLPAASAPPRFQLVGFSTTPRTGDAGVLGMTLECQNDFSGSRMCTSIEAMETVNVPSGLSGDAWIRPVFQPSGVLNALDASGVSSGGATNLTCQGWSFSTVLGGMVVNANGSFASDRGCDFARPVACCALVP